MRAGLGNAVEERHDPAVDRIEAALQLAFHGEAGTQRLMRIIKALEKRQATAPEEGGSLRDHLSAAVAELDLLRERARRRGVALDGWLAAVADDIGAVGPTLDIGTLETLFLLAGRMTANPLRAIQAQAAPSRNTVHILVG